MSAVGRFPWVDGGSPPDRFAMRNFIYTENVNMSRILVLTLTLLASARIALAQTDSTVNPRAVQPERPTVATHAGTVAPGYIELEEGVERDSWPGGEHILVAPTNL